MLKPWRLEPLPLYYDNSQRSMMLVDTHNYCIHPSNATMPYNVHCTISKAYKRPQVHCLGIICILTTYMYVLFTLLLQTSGKDHVHSTALLLTGITV